MQANVRVAQQAAGPGGPPVDETARVTTAPQGWLARLRLGFRMGAGKTILAQRLRQGPLAVQRVFYPEGDLCHTYLLHPPGGVAGGDTLDIHTRVAAGATALVTTPGATKFYRTAGPVALQQQRLSVDGGNLEWLPQENILFPGAEVELRTTVELSGAARFIGWEIHCLGRPANGEGFATGRALFRFSLLRDGLPLLHERLLIDGAAELSAPAGLRDNPVFGSLYATLDDPHLLEILRGAAGRSDGDVLGITLVDGLLIARYLGSSTERARGCFTRIWQILRPAVLHRPPCAPRIWNT